MKKGSDNITDNPLQLGEIELSAKTTAAQKEIWASIQIDSKANLCFNESVTIDLKGNLDIAKLKTSLTQFVARHDAFRSCFTPDGKNFVVYKNPELNFEYKDLSTHSQFSAQLQALRTNATKIEFDLINGPLYRFELVKQTEIQYFLIVSAHHLICDGWSLAIMVNEISSMYEGISLKSAKQFCDFSIQHNKKDITGDLQYWKSELSEAPTDIGLPLDFVREEFRSYESQRVDYQLNRDLVQKMQKLAAQNKMSFYHILFSGFNAFLQKITGQNDLVVGISSALQSTYGEYDLVGHLVQLLPIRSQVDESLPFIDLAQKVKAKMLDASEHSDITFGDIVQNIEIERSPNRIPLVNVIFNVDQQYPNQGFEFKHIEASYESNPRFYENFEIFVNATTLADKCVLECQYNTRLFTRETIQKWMVEFENLLLFFLDKNQLVGEYKLKNDLLKKSKTVDLSYESNSESLKADPIVLEKVLGSWKTVLKRENIESDSNFFLVGGHSLLAMDLVQLLKKEYGVKVSIKDIMLNPTPEKLSLCFNTLDRTASIQKLNIELKDQYRLSYSQKQTWFLQELDAHSNMFNLPSCIRIKTELDTRQLKVAYKKILEKHPALRTILVKGPEQKILPTESILDKLDFSVYESDLESAKADMNKLAHQSIDIYEGPLFQFKIYKLGATDFLIYNNFHHIIFDGWSFDIFFKVLNDAYMGHDLAIEQRSFQEYVLEQEGNLAKDGFQSRVENITEFIGSQPLQNLYPSDYERPARIDHSAGTIPFEFSTEIIDELSCFVKNNDISLYSLFMTCFAMTIIEKTGQDKIMIGTPLRARPEGDDMNTIGYFVNSLPVLIERAASKKATLNLAKEQILKTIEHEDIPLEVIIQRLKLKRDPSKTAIFQNFFSFQDVTNRKFVFGEKPYSQVNINKSTTHTDLDMWIKVGRGKIEGAIEYRLDLFKHETVDGLKERFFEIVSEFINDSDVEVESKDVIGAELDFSQPIHSAVEAFAERTPSKLAFHNSEIQLSYGELNSRANQMARHLQSKGVEKGDLVGLCSHRDEKLIISLLALMKLGAGYVPLDPYFPDERLHYMVEHSQIKNLIINEDLVNRFSELGVSFISLQNLDLSQHNDQNLNIEHDEEQTLYVIYTSGSTGKPKGVELGWRSVQNFIHSMKSTLKTNSETKLLAVTTLSFDIAVLELYLPLISGGTLVLANKFESIDGEELQTLIDKKNVNLMQATPATWRLLLNAGFNAKARFTVLCGGEPFPFDLAQTLLEKNFKVWNMYGPTETTVWSTMKELTLPLNQITIGKAIHNTDIQILDDSLNEVPVGEVGELCIGGEGLAKGYFKRPDLTNKVFIKNPATNERIYRTGDLAKLAPNGDIICLGRNDSQVKIRGYRIELGEIETRISQIPDVNTVAVVVKEFSETDKRLIAFFTSSDRLDEKNLRINLEDKLPSYMIPNQFIQKEDLPLTLNGKIDKKQLKQSLSDQTKAVDAIESELDPSHHKLEKIWSSLLGGSNYQTNDDFFEVGGHSLLAVELFSQLEKEFGVELKLSQLIEQSCFGQILDLVSGNNRAPMVNGKQLSIPTLCECLVPIEINRSDKIIFCFHGVGGNVLNYRVLSGFVKDYSLIGVQSIGVNGSRALPNSMDEMVDRYIAEIKQVQPSGSYILAGGSMGGTIALAAAEKLSKMGDQVDSVIMFDTFGPNLQVKIYSEDSLLKRIKDSFIWRARKYYSNTMIFGLRLLGQKIPHSLRYFDIEVQNYKIIGKFQVPTYQGRVDLIRAPQIEKTSYMDSQLGWSNILLGEFNIYEIEGHHEYFVEAKDLPHVVENIITDISNK